MENKYIEIGIGANAEWVQEPMIEELQSMGVLLKLMQQETVVEVYNERGFLFYREIEENNLAKALAWELCFHLESVEEECEIYFKGADANYLKGEWKQYLLKIGNIVNKYHVINNEELTHYLVENHAKEREL